MLLSETKNKFPFPPCKTKYSHKEEIGGVTSYDITDCPFKIPRS